MVSSSVRPSAEPEGSTLESTRGDGDHAGAPAVRGPDVGPVSTERRIGSFRELRALWREDRATNRRSIFTPGFQALAVHRFGVWARELRGPISRRVFKRIYVIINWFVRSFHGIELPAGARIGRRLAVGHQSGIVIHARAVIGDDCLIRHNVTIGALHAGDNQPSPRIGDRVEIGAGAVLLGAITVGDDAVIGPNVVVRVDVPPNAVVLPPEPTIVLRSPRRARLPRDG